MCATCATWCATGAGSDQYKRIRCVRHHEKNKNHALAGPSPPLLCSHAPARHHFDRCILVRPATRLTKHAPSMRRASSDAPRSKGPYSMRRGYHLSSSCGGAERPSSATCAPPVQHGGDQTCSQRAPCIPIPLVTTATVSTRSIANATAASGTLYRCTDSMPTNICRGRNTRHSSDHEPRRRAPHTLCIQWNPPPCTAPRRRCRWRVPPWDLAG